MPRPGRRPAICDAAIELAATGGTHAVTHQGVDRRLDLPRGSTSYYYRTREALVGAAAERLVERSRERFESRMAGEPMLPGVLIADYLDELLTERRADVFARLALALDPSLAVGTRDALSRCFFSLPAAERLMTALSASDPRAADSRTAADELVTVLEGIVAAHTYGMHRRAGVGRGDLAETVRPLVERMLPISSEPPPTTGSADPASR